MSLVRALRRLTLPFRRFARREDGQGAIELVIVLPMILYVFLLAFESGFYMTRRIMLERAVDLTVRALRLGQYTNPTLQSLRTEICTLAPILQDCNSTLTIELRPVSTTTWNLPAAEIACTDRDNNIQPAVTFNPGVTQELMLVRVCAIQDAMFPGVGIAEELRRMGRLDGDGGYAITAVSSFVNEP